MEAGDRLLSINDHLLHDGIDYRFYGAEERVVLEVDRCGQKRLISVTKEIDEGLGLEFREPPYRTCRNNCLFCFVHQMPRGLRRSLYVKDDDYRLSFLYGNYMTLTNLTDSDYERIFQQRLSPLYISVHATDEAVRRKLLGNPKAPPLLSAMKRLVSQGIRLHAQIVLCPGINDGEILESSIRDLMGLRPGVESVAVVPVGLTRHREGLEPLGEIDQEYAESFLEQVRRLQKNCCEREGEPWIFASDEFYLKAGRPFPPLESYGELPQLENGVGMVPLFEERVEQGLDRLMPGCLQEKFTIGTGVLAYPMMERMLRKINERTGSQVDLILIPNRFFGDSVTVAGLITGSDVIHAFADRMFHGTIVLPSQMLEAEQRVFLDDMDIQSVERRLGCRLRFVEGSAEGLLALFQRPGIP